METDYMKSLPRVGDRVCSSRGKCVLAEYWRMSNRYMGKKWESVGLKKKHHVWSFLGERINFIFEKLKPNKYNWDVSSGDSMLSSNIFNWSWEVGSQKIAKGFRCHNVNLWHNAYSTQVDGINKEGMDPNSIICI